MLTPQELDRLLALESKVAAQEIEANKVREHLQQFGGGELFLGAAGAQWGAVYVGGELASGLAMNAYISPDATSWLRYDTARIAALLTIAATGALQLFTAAPAANPIVWTTSGVATSVTAPITNSGTTLLPVIGIAAATTIAPGSMSAADKVLVNQLATGTPWTAATGLYAANWSGFATAGFADAKYRKNLDGQVQLLGLAKKGVALALPDTILTLPVGFRPATTRIFVTASALGTYTEIRVNTGGAVFIQVGGSAGFTALDGVTFDPAQ